MADVLLEIKKRETTGKKANKQLRREGAVPGIYYIHGEESVPVAVDAKELKAIVHAESNVIDLDFGDKETTKSVIRDVQWDPVDGHPVHVDFMGIKLTEKLQVDIPLHIVGTAVGVKTDGGLLDQILREISIETLPLDIPEHIEIDVSHLNIGDAFRVEDLKIDKVKILTDPSMAIVMIRPPALEVEEVAEEEEADEPEVVGEEKEDDEAQDS